MHHQLIYLIPTTVAALASTLPSDTLPPIRVVIRNHFKNLIFILNFYLGMISFSLYLHCFFYWYIYIYILFTFFTFPIIFFYLLLFLYRALLGFFSCFDHSFFFFHNWFFLFVVLLINCSLLNMWKCWSLWICRLDFRYNIWG